ncbi:hypothetical protein LDENG_00058450 [Xyrichtys novacula]|uniref:Uncharacterized protein n=1 Tax=Xyrichtys novacula TaxID=13765 RepID=A0AAV1GG40_XYRNO|nr:hypothetical protein LDENG_00058450 [Xyrichtys novacula]
MLMKKKYRGGKETETERSRSTGMRSATAEEGKFHLLLLPPSERHFSSGSRQTIQRLGDRSALLRSACLPENGPAGAWGSAVAACLNTRINTESIDRRKHSTHKPGEQCERGSAFPDVCCSFDLLLQLKRHPPSSPPPRSLAATVTRVQGQRPHPPRSLRSDLLVHPPPSPSTPRLKANCQLLSTNRPALPQQPDTPPGPRSISPTLPLTFAFDPLSLHSVLSVLNLPVAGYTQTITFVACFTAPNQRTLSFIRLPPWLVNVAEENPNQEQINCEAELSSGYKQFLCG